MCNKEVIPIDPSTTSIATHEMNEEAALSTSTSTSFPLPTSFLVESVWKSLCSELQIPSSLTASWWEIIFLEYTRPYRAYHTLQHLQEFIELYQQYSFALRSPSSPSQPLSSSHHIFLLAIFFHDLIYHPTTPQTNEDESILFFRLFVKECQAITPHDHLHQISPLVIELIDLTKKHQFGEDPQLLNPPHNAMLFCDMDMAILGSSRGRYEEYSQQVRSEYQHIPLPLYVKKRSEFLSTCLPESSNSKPPKRIFHTELFYTKYEHLAHENIRWELLKLQEMLHSFSKTHTLMSFWYFRLLYPIAAPLMWIFVIRKIPNFLAHKSP